MINWERLPKQSGWVLQRSGKVVPEREERNGSIVHKKNYKLILPIKVVTLIGLLFDKIFIVDNSHINLMDSAILLSSLATKDID